MKETESKILVDSSCWVDYFFTGKKSISDYIDSKKFFLISSAISLHEVKKRLLKEKYLKKEIKDATEFMKNHSIIIDVDEIICEKSAEDSFKLKLHTMDSIIYRTAIDNNAKIITLDNDFQKINQAIVL